MSQPSEITQLTSTTSESDVSSYFERVETGVKCILCKERWGSLTATTKKAHGHLSNSKLSKEYKVKLCTWN